MKDKAHFFFQNQILAYIYQAETRFSQASDAKESSPLSLQCYTPYSNDSCPSTPAAANVDGAVPLTLATLVVTSRVDDEKAEKLAALPRVTEAGHHFLI